MRTMSDGSVPEGDPALRPPDAEDAAASDLAAWAATDIAESVRSGSISPVEVTDAVLAQMNERNGALNAVIWSDADRMRSSARALADRIAHGDEVGPLAGVPYAIKEIHAVAGVPRTMGTPLLAGQIDRRSGVAARRIEEADALFLGKTNSSEFGWKPVTDCHQFGATSNPHDPTRTAGGSSGGSASAVAAGIVPLADGSDAGGSIRIPAAFCGVVGFKPSHGRVPIDYWTYTNTGIHVGPIARNVHDAALLYSVIAGGDPVDPQCIPGPVDDVLSTLDQPCGRMRVGFSRDLGHFDVAPVVADALEAARTTFEALGAETVESAPAWDDPTETMWRMWLQALSGAGDLLSARGTEVVDEDMLDVIETALETTSADHAEADRWRGVMWHQLIRWFEDFDLLVLPTVACTAFELGRLNPPELDGRPIRDRLTQWSMAWPFNLMAPCPVIAVPAGRDRLGLPIGIQIVGKPWADRRVLQAAAAFERAHPRP